MFTIDSNILDVLKQTDELIEERIPAAMEAALDPALWYTEAHDLAVRVILAIADPQERKFIPDFAQTVTASVLQGGGLSLQMHTPFPELRDLLRSAQAARAAMNPRDMMQNLFALPVSQFEELILQWVEEAKKKDSRDVGKSDQDIADLISYIMLSPNLTPGGKGEKARAALLPHITEFLQQKQVANRLPPEVVDRWLRAVLTAWRELVRVKYPTKVREQLHNKEGGLL